MMALNSLNSSSEALPASDSDMSADESQYGKTQQDGNRIASLQQENRVLKMELEMYKLRTKSLQEENKALRQASVSIVSFVCLPFRDPTQWEWRNGRSHMCCVICSIASHFIVPHLLRLEVNAAPTTYKAYITNAFYI